MLPTKDERMSQQKRSNKQLLDCGGRGEGKGERGINSILIKDKQQQTRIQEKCQQSQGKLNMVLLEIFVAFN